MLEYNKVYVPGMERTEKERREFWNELKLCIKTSEDKGRY